MRCLCRVTPREPRRGGRVTRRDSFDMPWRAGARSVAGAEGSCCGPRVRAHVAGRLSGRRFLGALARPDRRPRDRQDDVVGNLHPRRRRVWAARAFGAGQRRRGSAVVRRADRPLRRRRTGFARGAGPPAATCFGGRAVACGTGESVTGAACDRARLPKRAARDERARAAAGGDRRHPVARRALGRGAGVRCAATRRRAARVLAVAARRRSAGARACAGARPARALGGRAAELRRHEPCAGRAVRPEHVATDAAPRRRYHAWQPAFHRRARPRTGRARPPRDRKGHSDARWH